MRGSIWAGDAVFYAVADLCVVAGGDYGVGYLPVALAAFSVGGGFVESRNGRKGRRMVEKSRMGSA